MTDPEESPTPADEAVSPDTASAEKEAQVPETETPTPEPEGPSKEDLKLALKAFRKRLRLTRLDDESRMGYGPTSSGQKSGIVAITPPNQFPKEVWQELARQGKIKRDRGTLYSLVGEL